MPKNKIQQRIQYRYLLAKYCDDDFFVQAYMLKKLKEEFDRAGIPVPKSYQEFIEHRLDALREMLEKKRLHLEKATAKLNH